MKCVIRKSRYFHGRCEQLPDVVSAVPVTIPLVGANNSHALNVRG